MLIFGEGFPAHKFWLPDTTDVGRGFTKTVDATGAAEQPLTTGVMVNVTVTGEAVVFVNDPVIFPEPLFAIPVTEAVLFLVQL